MTLRMTGVAGLDMVLGGGVPTVARAAGLKETATILIRGAAGVGKSALAVDIAMGLGRQIGADIVHACVELLPSEVAAQYATLHPSANSVIVPAPFAEAARTGTTMFVGMLDTKTDPPMAWLGGALDALVQAACEAGGRPAVLVVDALSASYQLGGEVPREVADGLSKMGAEQGLILVLVEEVDDLRAPSAWPFAVDVVIELERANDRRCLRVTKNRYGPFDANVHELEFVVASGARVLPHPASYLRRWAPAHLGLVPVHSAAVGNEWSPIENHLPGLPSFRESTVVVWGPDAAWTRLMASWLGDVRRPRRWPDVVLTFDRSSSGAESVRDLREPDLVVELGDPYLTGHALMDRALEAVRLVCMGGQSPRRLLVGDLAVISQYRDHEEIRRALLVLAHVMRSETVPVVMFETTRIASRSWAADVANVLVEVAEMTNAAVATDLKFQVIDRSRAKKTPWASAPSNWVRPG